MKKIIFFILILFCTKNVFADDIVFKTPLNEINKDNKNDLTSQAYNRNRIENPRHVLDNNTKKVAARTIASYRFSSDKDKNKTFFLGQVNNLLSHYNANYKFDFNGIYKVVSDFFNMIIVNSKNCYGHYNKFDFQPYEFDYCKDQWDNETKYRSYITNIIDKYFTEIMLQFYLYNFYQIYYDLNLYNKDKELLNKLKNEDVYFTKVYTEYLMPVHSLGMFKYYPNYISQVKKTCFNENLSKSEDCFENEIFDRIRALADKDHVSDSEIKNFFKQLKSELYYFIKIINNPNINEKELLTSQQKAYIEFLSEDMLYYIGEIRDLYLIDDCDSKFDDYCE